MQLLVHRKGATRAFPPHHPLIPVDYQFTGQPVLIGGTMGTCSYVLTGAGTCRTTSPHHLVRIRFVQLQCLELAAAASRPICTAATGLPWLDMIPGLSEIFVWLRRHGKGHAADIWVDVPRGRARTQPQQQPQLPYLHAGAGQPQD